MAVQAQQYSENQGLTFCGSQEWMETGGGFDQVYLSLHQQQQQQMIIQNQQRNNQSQNLGLDCGQVISTNNHLPSMAFSQSLLAQVEKHQRQDIDRFIALQNERLRLALHEQRKQQLAVFLTSVESKAMNLLRQKDEQLTEVTRKTMELQDCLRKAEMENQAWQRVAKEKEAMVMALNNTLEQVRENVGCFASAAAEDAGSCCDFSHDQEETREEVRSDEQGEENRIKKMICKGCKSQDSCVLFLPCRHLCSCKSCEAFLDSCPVCKSVKKASIEVYMS